MVYSLNAGQELIGEVNMDMFNYDYAIDLAYRLSEVSSPCLLDYGCGAGQIVEKALAAGLDAYGVDEFYEGGSYREEVRKRGMLGARVLALKNGMIPFPAEKFDVVISNQVFEHIDDFTVPLAEIIRVLKPSGTFINIFPSVEVWREGHIGIPFIHWMPKGSRLRLYYALSLRRLGMGYFKGTKSARQWAVDQLNWIDTWTHYKPLEEIKHNFERHFTITFYDSDYILARIKKHPKLSPFSRSFESIFPQSIMRFVCAKFASRVFVLKMK